MEPVRAWSTATLRWHSCRVRTDSPPGMALPAAHSNCVLHTPAGAEAEERLKAQQMLRMLANRSNSRWVEKVEWEVPYTFDAVRFLKLLGESAVHV